MANPTTVTTNWTEIYSGECRKLVVLAPDAGVEVEVRINDNPATSKLIPQSDYLGETFSFCEAWGGAVVKAEARVAAGIALVYANPVELSGQLAAA